MGALEEIKRDNKIVADWLLFYPFRRRQYYQDIIAINEGRFTPEVVVKTGPGNPTLQQALRSTALEETSKWLEVIEIVESVLGPKKQVFLMVRRQAAYIQNRNIKGRPAWVAYVQHHYADEMAKLSGGKAEEYWLNETTIKEWWNSMVWLTARVAAKKGCI